MLAMPTEKPCSLCKDVKDADQFYVDLKSRSGLSSRCKPCSRAYASDRQKAKGYSKGTKRRWRSAILRRKFGISLDRYEEMLSSQGGVCAVCKRQETRNCKPDKSNCGVDSLSVDHCHDTGKVRGLLCHRCNLAIGLLRDDPEVLKSALAYIESHREPEIPDV